MIVMVVPVRIFHRTRFNSHAIASPRHDQNLINWPGFEEFASEAVYFPLAATASAFPFQPFPQHSQHVNHKSVWWTWAGKTGRATRYSFAYKLQMQVTFDWKQFEMISSLAGSFPSASLKFLPIQQNTSCFQCHLTCVLHTKGMCRVYCLYVQNVCVWRT